MGQLFLEYLEDCSLVYTCSGCRTHVCKFDDIISKDFRGRTGKAYLFDTAVNVNDGPPEERKLTTGLHTVVDVYCNQCSLLLGWKYTCAYEESQKYKEGKFIIEKARVIRESP